MQPNSSYSWLANKLLKLKEVVFPLIKLKLQDGLSARFWFDNWTPFGSLSTFLQHSSSRLGIPLKATVASICSNGNWRLPPARTDKQLQLHTYLTTVTLTHDSDYYEWEVAGKLSDKYNTGTVYEYLCGDIDEVNWANAIWSSYGIPRHCFLAWLVVKNRCPTRDRLISWGLQVSPLCLLCNSHSESRDHLFHDCPFSFDLWSLSARKCGIQPCSDWNGTLNQMIGLPLSRTRKPRSLLTLLAWK